MRSNLHFSNTRCCIPWFFSDFWSFIYETQLKWKFLYERGCSLLGALALLLQYGFPNCCNKKFPFHMYRATPRKCPASFKLYFLPICLYTLAFYQGIRGSFPAGERQTLLQHYKYLSWRCNMRCYSFRGGKVFSDKSSDHIVIEKYLRIQQ